MNKGFAAVVVSSVLILVLALPVYANYLDIGASNYANHSANITIKGFIRLDSSAGINNTNITASVGSSNYSVFTNTSQNWTSGFFEFNLTAPNSTGYFNVSFSSGTLTKNVEIYVSNLTGVAFNFTSNKPPFTNGTSFAVNISFAGRMNSAPNLEIFSANGGNSSGWVMNNMSSRINTPSILYNITVPANADGRYMMVFERGAGATIFLVKSSVVVVANTEDSANSTTTNFGQGENFEILGKVRDANNAILNANVVAFVTYPNGTVVNVSMTHNGTGVDGTYNGAFTNPGLKGDYKIEIVANVSGRIFKSTTSATIQSLEAKLDVVKDFFFDFGSSSGFRKNGPVEFNVLVYNLSSDILLNGSTTAAASTVFCNNLTVAQLKNSLNGSALSTPAITKTTNLFLGQTVCKINFTAPDTDGIYAITLNASVGTDATNTVMATGYFSIQSYIMKPNPVSSIGGGKEFMSFIMPGSNATFEVSVRNLSSNGTAVAGNLIINATPIKITPMEFIGGAQSDITNIVTVENTTGTATSNPKVKIKVPENLTGPFQIEFQASVAGQVITGRSFYFARYVEGFVFPGGFGGGFSTGAGEEGPGGGEGGGPGGPGGGFEGGTFRCAGQQNFTARIFDVRTRQAAKNVVFNSIQEAREEMTGRSVRNSLVLAASTVTDNNGIGNLTINFSSSLSGFHFMLINITTADGKLDTLPGGFECRQLSFFPQIQAIGSGGSGGYFVAPTSGINMVINGIKNLNTRNVTVNGTVNIIRLESFDPSKGPKFMPGLADTFPIINGAANITVYPSNFSGLGGKWSSGFTNIVIRLCDNRNNTDASDDVCDTNFGGFMVVAFDAFPDYSSGSPSQTLIAGNNITYNIQARTNVTGFSVQIGLPWEGSLQDATLLNYSLKSDGWNHSTQTGFDNFERWNVTFTVPSNLRKGGNMIIIKVTNYLGETTNVEMFATASKLSISVPDAEGALMSNFGVQADILDANNVTNFYANYGVSLTAINASFKSTNSKSGRACVIKDFNVTRFSFSDQGVTYKTNAALVVIDNTTAGVYDTLIINNSNQIAAANANNRSLAAAGFPGIYLISVEDCGYVKLINSTVTESSRGSGFAGQHAVSSIVTIPFIIKQGTSAKSDIRMDVSQIVQQEDFGGGRGGFGFKDMLAENSYTRTSAVTDSNGVAFLRLNISRSGMYSIIWNFTDTVSGDTDIADFSEGIGIDIKAFMTSMDSGSSNYGPRVVTLTLNNTTPNVMETGSHAYVGAWNESVQGELFDDTSSAQLYYIALRNVTQVSDLPQVLTPIVGGAFTELIIDNDENLNTSSAQADTDGLRAQDMDNNWTKEFGFSYTRYKVDGNFTVNSTVMKLVFGKRDWASAFISSSSTRIDTNVTVRACAFTYARPATPLIGANVTNVTTQRFSFNGPPVTEGLNVYDPFTGTNVTSVLTGPSGCATFNVSRGGGWTAGFPNDIKGVITSGGYTEQAFLGNVFVYCSSGCSS